MIMKHHLSVIYPLYIPIVWWLKPPLKYDWMTTIMSQPGSWTLLADHHPMSVWGNKIPHTPSILSFNKKGIRDSQVLVSISFLQKSKAVLGSTATHNCCLPMGTQTCFICRCSSRTAERSSFSSRARWGLARLLGMAHWIWAMMGLRFKDFRRFRMINIICIYI